jgi:hypothetical protein
MNYSDFCDFTFTGCVLVTAFYRMQRNPGFYDFCRRLLTDIISRFIICVMTEGYQQYRQIHREEIGKWLIRFSKLAKSAVLTRRVWQGWLGSLLRVFHVWKIIIQFRNRHSKKSARFWDWRRPLWPTTTKSSTVCETVNQDGAPLSVERAHLSISKLSAHALVPVCNRWREDCYATIIP